MRFANGGGLQLGMIGEQIFLQNFDFVVRKILFVQIGTLLQNNYAEAVGGKFFGQNAASGAGTHDDEIDGVGSFVFGLIDFHFFSASFVAAATAVAGCQPG